ncbi:MAG: apolipoprotein N-acyltransferase [Pelatocladus maniniholoensis HA4357-MV3]|jgi:apolipoprotein N-acyltransferase|uniref:Apolipoprotein N-acyltransferase n=1 Tax=Pelatocladus maniniholoensis HA4357-MV3 TaxID=1117104 RepID=A0A9E3HAV8_9NOST|nr:apolipoprotein N-acyltransferase [Pelatocladus maniniholoensis HA4357-MV3]
MRQNQSKKGHGNKQTRGRGEIFTLSLRGSVLLRFAIAAFSGILMGLTVAPINAWFLAWFALAPLWVLVVNSAKPKIPLLSISLAWGIGYHGFALSWITGIHPMTWMGVPWLASLGIAVFCWVFITLWGAASVAVWATGMRIICYSIPQPYVRVLIGTALWCGVETILSWGALFWSSISYTQSPYNLAILHLGQLSGPYAVTAAIVAVNGLIAEAFINCDTREAPWRFVNKYLITATGLLTTLHLIGFVLYTRPLIQPPTAALKIGIIQGNIPNQIKLYPEGLRRALEGYTTGYLTLANQKVDAVLTPEGALPFFEQNIMRSSLVAAVRSQGVVAWIGGFGQKGKSYTNSLLTVTKDGKLFSHYDKVKLVPIGEYVPFEELLGSIISRLSPLDEHQVPGSPNQIFNTPFGRAIASICYESAFPEVFRYQAQAGGQFILSSSNDAHYSASMPAQHHAQDIMRAIETDRWAVRATNTGYSAFVDPHGRTKWISGHNTYEIHAETIYRRQTQSLYVRWGDWLTPLLLVSAGGIWLINFLIVQLSRKQELN